MSSQTPQQSPVSPVPPPQNAWSPRRYHWGWRHIRREKDKQLHFPGQEADETVTRVARRHWLFLVRPALPFIASVIGTFLVPLGYAIAPGAGSLWTGVELVMVFLSFATGGWFVYRELILWWLDIDIITNKRIINWRGGFRQPTRKETPLEKVQQVAIVQKTPWQFMFNYGDLHLYLIGGTINIEKVPNPREVKEAIWDASERFKAKKPPKEKPPKVPDPDLNAILEKLGEPKPIAKLPDADDNYPPLHADRRIGPKRTFGGPLRIILDIHYTSGEYSVMYLQKSIYVLLGKLVIPVLLLLAVLPSAIYGSSLRFIPAPVMSFWWFIMSAVILGLLITIFFTYVNYVDDVYILTNQRIIEIERQFLFLYEDRIEAEYKNLRDIKVQMPTFLNFLLDVGDVYIETPGSMPDIVFKSVSHPFFVQDKIYEIKGNREKADETKKDNERREELHLWFGKVIGKLEQTSQLKGAPNLQNLDFIDAMERASELGLQVVVWDEDPSSGLPPGLVIQQSPPPGTVINPGGEIQVVLSR